MAGAGWSTPGSGWSPSIKAALIALLAAGVATIVVTTLTVTTLKLEDGAGDHTISIAVGDEAANRNIHIPPMGADRTWCLTATPDGLGAANSLPKRTAIGTLGASRITDAGSGAVAIAAPSVSILDAASANVITIAPAGTEKADRALGIPALGGDRTVVVTDTLGSGNELAKRSAAGTLAASRVSDSGTGAVAIASPSFSVQDGATKNVITVGSATTEGADRALGIPALGGTRTIVVTDTLGSGNELAKRSAAGTLAASRVSDSGTGAVAIGSPSFSVQDGATKNVITVGSATTEGADRALGIPALGGTRTIVVTDTLGSGNELAKRSAAGTLAASRVSDSGTGAVTIAGSGIALADATLGFHVTVTTSNESADRTLTVPVLGGNRTVAITSSTDGAPNTWHESGGQTLTAGAAADGEWLKRVGTTIVSAALAGTNIGLTQANVVLGRGTPKSGATEELTLASTYGLTFSYTTNGLTINTPQDLQTSGSPTFANATIAGTFAIREGGGTPTYHTTFTGADQTTNIGYTLPAALPSATQFLQCATVAGTSATLTWATVSGGGGITGSGTSGQLPKWTGASALGDSGIVLGLMSGTGSIAVGTNATCSGNYGLALGTNAVESGGYANAIGESAAASGAAANAIGANATASGLAANALGYASTARVDGTTNLTGPLILRRAETAPVASAFRNYAAAHVVLAGEEMTLLETNSVSVVAIPAGARFYPDFAGMIVTALTLDGGTITAQPTLQFGTTATPEFHLAAALTANLDALDARQHYTTLLDSKTPVTDASPLQCTVSTQGTITGGAGAEVYRGRPYWIGMLVEAPPLP